MASLVAWPRRGPARERSPSPPKSGASTAGSRLSREATAAPVPRERADAQLSGVQSRPSEEVSARDFGGLGRGGGRTFA